MLDKQFNKKPFVDVLKKGAQLDYQWQVHVFGLDFNAVAYFWT